MATSANSSGNAWLLFALLTVVTWGLYGFFLHKGQILMADNVNGRYKAFLFVGIAYFLVAVLAPAAMLVMQKASWNMPASGMGWSLFAGVLGAIGAFGVLLAFGAQGKPPVVMSIVFAGAPVVNALYSIYKHPPEGGWGSIKWPFYVGILMAAMGGYLVTKFKPNPAPPGKAAAHASVSPKN